MSVHVVIRNANSSDALRISEVHCLSWLSTYRGIISDDYLEKIKLSFDDCSSEQRRRKFIEDHDGQNTFVAEVDGVIVGFAEGGISRESHELGQAEIYAFYLVQQYQGMGIGRKLFHAFVEQYAKNNGMRSLVIRTMAKADGKEFYQKIGGQLIAEFMETIAGGDHQVQVYKWIF